MIHLNIEAQTTEDLHAKLKGILYGLAQAPALELAPGEKVEGMIGVPAAQASPEPAKRGRKPKVVEAEAAVEAAIVVTGEAQTSATEAAKEAGVPSIDDLRKALMQLANADGHGSDAVFTLLGEFGAKNASTVPEDKRADVIAKINEKLGG